MIARILAITAIFIATTVAWMILGATISSRTRDTGERLSSRVQSVWGTPQAQLSPTGAVEVMNKRLELIQEKGITHQIIKEVPGETMIRPEQSRITVDLALEHRKKGLLWYSTYTVAFAGAYVFRNPDAEPRNIQLRFPLPAEQALYDGLLVTVDGKPQPLHMENGGVRMHWQAAPGAQVRFAVKYKSQGLDAWRYGFTEKVSEVLDFDMKMSTNFKDIDFPDNSLSPVRKTPTAAGWQLEWTYQSLLSGFPIAMDMPNKLQPGPLAAEISYFAPVSLFFFFFLLFLITTLRGIELHPMNYFFLAASFFSFHLLLAYLVDHLDLHVSFFIASVVSIALTASYLRLVAGSKFAFREASIGQFVYLVLFSYAFFFRGLTGLTITVGAIATLFIAMQTTGRIRWSERFSTPIPPPLNQA